MAVEYRILQALQILRDGVVVECGGTKQRAVLADLLIHANEVVSVDRLIDDLWGGRPPATATNTLQVYISGIRKSLGSVGAEALLTRKPGYVLVVDQAELDVFRFEALVAAGRAALGTDVDLAADKLTEALSLWRGAPLSDLGFEDFVAREALRLEDRRAEVVEDLVEAELRLGRCREAVGRLQRHIAAHPLRERPRGQLMIAQYRAGRQAEALAGYRSFRAQLHEELGIEPSALIRDLESAILRQDDRMLGAAAPVAWLGQPRSPGFGDSATAPVRARSHTIRERKRATILWCDMEPFESDSMDELEAQCLRAERRQQQVVEVVRRHGGTPELTSGGIVMAVFGSPTAHEDDPHRAVDAALSMLALMANRAEDAAGHVGGVRIRAGVATGDVMATLSDADPPSETSRAQVAGDVVGEASRVLESAPYGTVTVAHSTYLRIAESFECEDIPVTVGAGSRQLRRWRVLGHRPGRPRGQRMRADWSVGRDSERQLLVNALARARRTRKPHLVTIIGEPGVGKSRLVRDVHASLHDDQPEVVWREGHCRPYGDPVGLWALAEIVRQHLGIEPAADPEGASAKVDEGIPASIPECDWLRQRIKPLLGIESAAPGLEQSFVAWRTFLEMMARDAPTVVVIEDLHWAFETMISFLEHTATFALDSPLLLVVTTRPELLEHCPRWATGPQDALSMHLEPLTDPEMDILISRLLGDTPISRDLRHSLLSRAGGNPLFAEEFITWWLQVQEASSASWRLDPDNGQELPMPASIRDTVAARIDTLSLAQKTTLRSAATVAGAFGADMLAAVGPDAPESVDRALLDLSRLGFLRRTSDAGWERSEFAFRHMLVRDVCYRQIPREDRAAHHERAANWLVGVGATDGLVGYHLARAFRDRAASQPLDGATADLALRAMAHLLAESERALHASDTASATRLSGRVERLLAACQPALTGTLAPPPHLVERAARLMVALGRWQQAVDLLSPYAGHGSPVVERALGVALCQLDRSNPLSSRYREGQRRLALAAGSPRPDTDALASLAGTWKGLDDRKARELYARCLEIEGDNPYALGNLLEYEVAEVGSWTPVEHRAAQIEAAYERCLTQLREGENLPWAVFDAGKFALLAGREDETFAWYAYALRLTSAEHMVVTTMRSLDRLNVAGASPDLEFVRILLAVGRAARFPSAESRATLPASEGLAMLSPGEGVLIVSGGTDRSIEPWLDDHRAMLARAFRGHRGLVVSGGTTAGVPGLVGFLRSHAGSRVRAMGYLPADLPPGTSVDTRYDDLRRTAGTSDFTIADSLQAWSDLFASAAGPSAIKMLGIGGGPLAAAEYRIALALGCPVGVVAGSGRAADDLLDDPDWRWLPLLRRIEPNEASMAGFLGWSG